MRPPCQHSRLWGARDGDTWRDLFERVVAVLAVTDGNRSDPTDGRPHRSRGACRDVADRFQRTYARSLLNPMETAVTRDIEEDVEQDSSFWGTITLRMVTRT